MALGAHRRDILALILLRGMRILVAGLAVGVAGALAITRVMAHMLFGISPSDLLTYAAVGLRLAAGRARGALFSRAPRHARRSNGRFEIRIVIHASQGERPRTAQPL